MQVVAYRGESTSTARDGFEVIGDVDFMNAVADGLQSVWRAGCIAEIGGEREWGATGQGDDAERSGRQ